MARCAILSFVLLLTACSGGSGGGQQPVNDVNRPPVASNDAVEVVAGTSKIIDVLANDRDPDRDPLTISSITQPGSGTATISASGEIAYTPAPGFSGPDRLNYIVSDGRSGRATGVVTISVYTVGVAKAVADSAVTTPDTPIALRVLDNDIADDPDSLALASYTAPLHGTVVIDDNGTPQSSDDFLSYTPAPGFTGIDSVIYNLASGHSAVVEVTVTSDPAVAVGDVVRGSVLKGAVVGALVELFDIDVAGQITGPPLARAITDEDGQFQLIVPLPRRNLIAQTSGGRFADESKVATDPNAQRNISLSASEHLTALLPQTASYLAVNVYTNALLLSARADTTIAGFTGRYNASRSRFAMAFGFDIATTKTTDPMSPDQDASLASRQYGLALGGAAIAIGSEAVRLGMQKMTYPLISAVIEDLTDCSLDGRNSAGVVQISIGGESKALSTVKRLNTEILRFRNNNIAKYSGTELIVVDTSVCTAAYPVPPNNSPTGVLLSASSVAEDAVPATLIGILSTTDADAFDTHDYSLVAGITSGDNSAFEIDGNRLFSSVSLDYETQSSYVIEIQTSDGVSTPYNQFFTINVTDVDDPPTNITLTSGSIDENMPAGTIVGLFAVTDADPGDIFTYVLVSGAGDSDNVRYSIVGNQLNTTTTFDYETGSVHTIRVRADNGVVPPGERTFTITVIDTNDAPTAVAISSATVNENLPPAAVIGVLTATDQDAADTHAYTLVAGSGDSGNGFFAISGNQLLSAASFDFEAQSSYSILVQADDGNSVPARENFIIAINDVNESPTNVVLSANLIDENRPSGTSIGILTTSDPDTSDTHTYTFVPGTGDSGNSQFSISGNQLRSAAAFDFEAQASYSIRVSSADGISTGIERQFAINVTDVNESPTSITLSANTVAENLSVATVVGNLGSTDDDPADGHTYTLVSGAGDTGNTSFTISGSQLLTAASFDYETQASYSIRVQTNDSVSPVYVRNLTINITDVNESPTDITLSANTVAENQPFATVVGNLASTDEDPADSHAYTLVSGAGDTGNASFTISGSQLLTAASFDYETQSSYSIRVQTDDSVSPVYVRNLTINIDDVNESPTDITLSANTVAENQPFATVVGNLASTDEDPADSHAYTLVSGAGDTGNASFTISGSQLLTAASFDYETQSSYSIRIRTDDSVSPVYVRNLTINVSDVNESPSDITLSNNTVAENMAVATVVGNLASTDEDPADSHTYTLVSGAGDSGNTSFTVSGTQLQTAASFDYETQASYSIRVQTDDSVSPVYVRNLTINVSDVNESPVAADDFDVTAVDLPRAVYVLSNDTDPDGDALSILSVVSPTTAGGITAINDNGTPGITTDDYIDYTPPALFSGSDDFSYSVGDGALSVAATVNVMVSNDGYVAGTMPLDGSSMAAVGANVDIVFNQAMNPASLDATSLRLSLNNNGTPAIAATLSYNAPGLTATIDPGTDLDPGTVYWIVVAGSIENASGIPQGFLVKSSFTTTATPGDTDADGMTDADELFWSATHTCLDPSNPDSDGDLVGDGAEFNAGGDPCVDQGQGIFLVDGNGGAGGTIDWAGAPTMLAASYPDGASASNPNYVLIASGTYLDEINYASCSNLVFAGSQSTATPGTIQHNPDGSPTTVIDMQLARNSEFANCADISIRNIHLKGGTGNAGKGGGMRVSGTTTATLDGVWLTDNTVGDQGGGLGVSNFSIATVRNSVLRNNVVTAGKGGGGIWVGANATLDVADTLIIENTSNGAGGGGLYFDPLASGFVSNTIIVDNNAARGGGVYILNTDGAKNTWVDIEDSVISGNKASVDGGGVYINGIGAGASLFGLRHNLIADNAAVSGGGIMLENVGTIVTVQNNLMLNNFASNEGGGVFVNGSGSPQLINNTLAYNRAGAASGAAIAGVGAINPSVLDSVIWQNRAGGRALSTPVSLNDNYSATIASSNFNLLEVDKIGASDIDFVSDGVVPDFEAGFYLNQLTSVAIDTGSDTAAFLGLDTRYSAATGAVDSGTVDRGYHYPDNTVFPADGYVETGGGISNNVSVGDADIGVTAVELLIRPLQSGTPIGRGHYVIATLEGVNTALAQLRDGASTDPSNDGESVIMSDLGNGDYRAVIDAQGTVGSSTPVTLRIRVDGIVLPVVFEIDRVP